MTRPRVLLPFLLAALVAAEAAGAGEAPKHVVSMNLCTDQLAMMLAAPGQLVSVSTLAADPQSSSMADEAGAHILNHGLAEEIFLLHPDLVIAGTYSNRATVAMLRRLGIPVAVFDPAYSLADVRARILEIGAALGRDGQAAALAAEFDARLAVLRTDVARRPRAALFYANSYTSGDRTLAGQILIAAGFVNIAAEAGLPDGGTLPLEVLAMAAPEIVVTGNRYPGASRSETVLDHPVLAALGAGRAAVTDRDWVCGTPYVLDAIEALAGARQAMEGAP